MRVYFRGRWYCSGFQSEQEGDIPALTADSVSEATATRSGAPAPPTQADVGIVGLDLSPGVLGEPLIVDGVFEGTVTEAAGGRADGEPLLLHAEVLPRDVEPWPPASWIVDANTFPGALDGAQGRRYPAVFGRPGAEGTPALPLVQLTRSAGVLAGNKLLVGGGALSPGTVTVHNTTKRTSWTATLQTGTDGLGQTYTYVLPTAVGDGVLDEGDALFAAFDGTGGGLPDPASGGPLRSLSSVLRWAGRMAGRQVVVLDAGASIAVDTYLTEPCDPWEWALSELLPVSPVWVSQSGSMVRVGGVDLGTLEEGTHLHRTGALQISGLPARRTLLSWAPSEADGGARLLVQQVPTVSPVRAVSVTVPWCYDQATAGILARGYQEGRVARGSYILAPWASVPAPGSTLTLVDPRLPGPARAVVEGVQVSGVAAVLRIRARV